MIPTETRLRLHLAEKWEPQDYLSAISAVETIYYVTLFANPERESGGSGDPRRRLDRPRWTSSPRAEELILAARELADREERLIVNEIRHASPGFIDFDGLGQIADAMDKAFGRIIALVTERKLRHEWNEQAKVETEVRRENLNTIKIENARRLLELDRDYPDLRRAPALERILVEEQSKIENLAARGLITDQREHRD